MFFLFGYLSCHKEQSLWNFENDTVINYLLEKLIKKSKNSIKQVSKKYSVINYCNCKHFCTLSASRSKLIKSTIFENYRFKIKLAPQKTVINKSYPCVSKTTKTKAKTLF